MTTALAEALAARGRVWGANNAAVLAEMRDEFVPGPVEVGQSYRRGGPGLATDDYNPTDWHYGLNSVKQPWRSSHRERARERYRARYRARKAAK